MDDSHLATHDEEVLRDYIRSTDVLTVLSKFDSFVSSWNDVFHLRALANSLCDVNLENDSVTIVPLFCSICHKLAAKNDKVILSAIFANEKVRMALLLSMETGAGRRDASGAFVKLCLFCLKEKSVDVVVSSFVRFLIIPLRRVLQDKDAGLQSIANAAQIVAARCASQSFNKMREPDEVVLFAENGLFDDLGSRLEIEALRGPIMNAIQGLMTSPAALEKIDSKG
jgi:hypothetical protein